MSAITTRIQMCLFGLIVAFIGLFSPRLAVMLMSHSIVEAVRNVKAEQVANNG